MIGVSVLSTGVRDLESLRAVWVGDSRESAIPGTGAVLMLHGCNSQWNESPMASVRVLAAAGLMACSVYPGDPAMPVL